MQCSLDKISIHGFKSIKALTDFPLGSLNVIVGGNGAGKSNFVDFFRMLGAMSEEALTAFVTKNGGADGFFFNGPKETRQIEAHLYFKENQYRFTLEPTVNGLMVAKEGTFWEKKPKWQDWRSGKQESRLKSWKNKRSTFGDWLSVEGHIYEAVSNWIVYHFHDTSKTTAPMRKKWPLHDKRRLNHDASNIASVLYSLMNTEPEKYERIIETIQLVAPFFDEFILEPEMDGENEVISLQWKQKGSSFPFKPWQFSDGTIRFICLATALLQELIPSTILIDEPELGLHPFALDVLAGLMKEACEQTQLIVSTQSAALLNHFDPKEVIVVDRESGASTFRRLDESDLTSWLQEYSMGELWQKNVIDGGPRCE